MGTDKFFNVRDTTYIFVIQLMRYLSLLLRNFVNTRLLYFTIFDINLLL